MHAIPCAYHVRPAAYLVFSFTNFNPYELISKGEHYGITYAADCLRS